MYKKVTFAYIDSKNVTKMVTVYVTSENDIYIKGISLTDLMATIPTDKLEETLSDLRKMLKGTKSGKTVQFNGSLKVATAPVFNDPRFKSAFRTYKKERIIQKM